MRYYWQNLWKNKSSMRSRLMAAFIGTSVLPIIILNLFSYYNSASIVRENIEEMTSTNLEQMNTSLNVWLESYEDILYQLYTDDELVELTYRMNREEDVAVTVNQMKRILRGVLNSKEYIRSISVITANGEVINCDKLTAITMENSWMATFSLAQDELYDLISVDNQYHLFSTEYASNFANDDYYMFHLSHRIINYKKLDERIGVIIISLDEQLLKEICTSQTQENGLNEDMNHFYFLVDGEGRIVSYIDSAQIGRQIPLGGQDENGRKKAYQSFIDEIRPFGEAETSVYVKHNDKFGWDIVNVSNQSKVLERLSAQQKMLGAVAILSITLIIVIILILTTQLTASLKKLMLTMKKAGGGELVARVDVDRKMPLEVENIALQFNSMLEKLELSMENEKESAKRQRNAEITALESQINPHFLYNTLDTINWMAIDKDEFEISNAISSLATILRYAIDNSNGIVMIREEVDWLKKYIFLQQTRLKNAFSCDIHVAPEVLDKKVHKLLLQPFVENAILHGFEGMDGPHELRISIVLQNGCLEICIRDNGKGIEAQYVEEINQRIFKDEENKRHIGLKNAITRLEMYYGKSADICVKSELMQGTQVTICIMKGALEQ